MNFYREIFSWSVTKFIIAWLNIIFPLLKSEWVSVHNVTKMLVKWNKNVWFIGLIYLAMKWSYNTHTNISKYWDKTYIVCQHPRNKNKCLTLLQVLVLILKFLAPKVGLGLEGQVVKFIDITNFFSYTYYTDHKNGYSRPESRNLD